MHTTDEHGFSYRLHMAGYTNMFACVVELDRETKHMFLCFGSIPAHNRYCAIRVQDLQKFDHLHIAWTSCFRTLLVLPGQLVARQT